MFSNIFFSSPEFAFHLTDPQFEHLTDAYAGAFRLQTPYEDGPSIDPSLTLYNPTPVPPYEPSGDFAPNGQADDTDEEDVTSADEDITNDEEDITGDEEDVTSDEEDAISDEEGVSSDEEYVDQSDEDDGVATLSPSAHPATARASPPLCPPTSLAEPQVVQEVASTLLFPLSQPSASSSPPGRRSKRLLSRPAIDYAGQADDASDEEMPAKRRRPLSTVQGATESRSRNGNPSSSKGLVKKSKGLAGSAKKSKVRSKSPKGARQTTGRRAATAATNIQENMEPERDELPPDTVRWSLLY